jgi:cytochrome c
LGDPAQRTGRSAGSVRLHGLTAIAIVNVLAALMLTIAAGVAAAKAPALSGDARAGEAVYTRCLACHALAYDRTGPRHCGLFGRLAGSVQGFDYSEAMKRSNIRWNEAALDRFLANPAKEVPGTTMGYAGITDRKERADLNAYLKQATDSPECRK